MNRGLATRLVAPLECAMRKMNVHTLRQEPAL
jgi:hypothetical protein